MKKQNRGFSLISLIITIIVIITIAAVVIFSGMGTPEKAQLSAIISDIDNVQTAVDQAYYGFYTEKSVAGEVWTKSQFYEAVATGETNRDNLTGTGIIPISDGSMLKMTLPKYEGRTWGVAVEDIDNHTQVGSVVLLPGYETDGKIYATLLDVQNDGRDAESMEEAMQKVSGKGGNQGDKLTDEEKEIIFAKVHVGDFVNYRPSAGNSTMLYKGRLGLENTNVKITSQEMNWRILGIDDESGKVLITTYGTPRLYYEDGNEIDGIYLYGAKGYVNGPSELNRICKELYSDNSKGIVARSMTVDDLNKAENYIPVESGDNYACYSEDATETLDVVANGKIYKGIVCESSYGRVIPRFYAYIDELSGKSVTVEVPVSPSISKPVLVSDTGYYYELSSTIQKILGNGGRWLASRCVNAYENHVDFNLFSLYVDDEWNYGGVDSRGELDKGGLYWAIDRSHGYSYGICPVISINPKLLDISDENKNGQSADSAWNLK